MQLLVGSARRRPSVNELPLLRALVGPSQVLLGECLLSGGEFRPKSWLKDGAGTNG